MSPFTRKVLLFIILAELLSLFSFLLPQFAVITFWTIISLFLIISLYQLEWGLYLLLAELFIGSKGYLFFYEQSGVIISIRIALFIIFVSIWLARLMNRKKCQALIAELKPNKSLVTSYLLLITIIAIGLVNGLLKNYPFDNIFFDFNGWLYFILFLPFLDLIKSKETITKIFQVFFVAISWIAVKTLAAFYFFSHQLPNTRPIYKWLRNSGVGEITIMPGGLSRIFFQSQIFVLIGLFVILTLIIYKVINKQKVNVQWSIINVLLFTAIIASLSRSYWVGAIFGVIVFLAYLSLKQKISYKNILKISGGLITTLAVSLALIFAIIKVPPGPGTISANLLEKRFIESQESVGGSSRLNQLKPLLNKIIKHPVIGSGFGATVTYQSEDPRIKTNLNPQGWYTTYAFEWGYLDLLLKLGILGLIVYLYFIFLIIKQGYKFIIYPLGWARGRHLSFTKKREQLNDKCKMTNDKFKILTLGLLLGIIALLTTNIFSPYLNHPLGIGYVLLCAAIFISLKQDGLPYPGF